MKLLRARLYQVEVEKRQVAQEKLEGEKKHIAFGSQIRSYTLQPYQLVKDVRTGFEMGDAQRVLDGISTDSSTRISRSGRGRARNELAARRSQLATCSRAHANATCANRCRALFLDVDPRDAPVHPAS